MTNNFRMQNSKAAKINAADVMKIRELYGIGWTQSRLCREFQISIGQIGRIVRGESWQQLPKIATEEEIAQSKARALALLGAEFLPEGMAPQTTLERLAADVAAEAERGKAADKALDELTADAEDSGSEF